MCREKDNRTAFRSASEKDKNIDFNLIFRFAIFYELFTRILNWLYCLEIAVRGIHAVLDKGA